MPVVSQFYGKYYLWWYGLLNLYVDMSIEQYFENVL